MVGINFDIPDPQDDEEPCTEKQRGFILALFSKLGMDSNQLPFPLEDLGKWQASSFIDQLQDIVKQMHGDKPFDWSRFDEKDLAEIDEKVSRELDDSPVRTRSGGSRAGDKLLIVAGGIIVLIIIAWLAS